MHNPLCSYPPNESSCVHKLYTRMRQIMNSAGVNLSMKDFCTYGRGTCVTHVQQSGFGQKQSMGLSPKLVPVNPSIFSLKQPCKSNPAIEI
ncbi:hypothetical protein AVEN_26664-1 [Araneus ventricosus]|uniref:Uncharacterized protein n=1 Tax=Araneus ventricosus TaxID=182803 RepID=A0A4Y2GPH4_ARAVE|nr:hypothetical protein AVEN_26664-1 [Araneus ventricosus]